TERVAPPAHATVLGRGQHGLIALGSTARECYQNLPELIDGAERFVDARRRASPKAFLDGGRLETTPAGSDEERRRRAALVLPLLRGSLARRGRAPILHLDDSAAALAFAGSARAAQLGPR